LARAFLRLLVRVRRFAWSAAETTASQRPQAKRRHLPPKKENQAKKLNLALGQLLGLKESINFNPIGQGVRPAGLGGVEHSRHHAKRSSSDNAII
jgi:hypothetical protein